MLNLSIPTWIANAAACLTGMYGDVTHQAEAADRSRQTVSDPAQKVQAAVEAEHSGGPTRAELIPEAQDLRQEDARPWDWLAQTIESPPAKQHESTVTATAMGLGLNQVLVLLALIRGAQARPGRPTIQRGTKAAGPAAERVLKHLDGRSKALVLVGCLDEAFFHRRPVLVGVAPASRVWSPGQKADDRTGATGSKALQDWTALEYVVADAGTGLQAGIAAVPQRRRKEGRPAWEDGLDGSHTAQEAQRVLRRTWDRVDRLWEQAEVAPRRVAQAPRPGQDARGGAVAARSAGTKAGAAFPRYERSEAGGKIAPAALQVFRPDGQLNDRSWAGEQVAWALPQWSGREWSQVRGFLPTGATWTFLDRPHRQLQGAEPEDELRGASVRSWWLRRQRPRAPPVGAIAGARPGAHRVHQVVWHQRDAHGRASYRQVARVLGQTVRARGAVGCMNSVIRMHQARHRTLTQGLLGLKRWYGNRREFRGGKRKGRCAYEHLGLKLSSSNFWGLLPEEMITARDEAKAKAKGKGKAIAA